MAAKRLLHRLASVYYLSNYAALLVFLYLYRHRIRPQALSDPVTEKRLLEMGYSGVTHEKEIVGMVVLAYLLKLKRRRNFDEAWNGLLVHGSILSILLIYQAGNYTLMYGFLIVYGAMMWVVAPPPYGGKSQVIPLNPYIFSSQIREKFDAAVSHVVVFNTPWASDCRFFEPVFADLSVAYTSATKKFASIDLETYPELATEFGIDITTASKQLPTVILFYKGQEVRRLPPFSDEGKVLKTMMDKKNLTRYFELDVDVKEES